MTTKVDTSAWSAQRAMSTFIFYRLLFELPTLFCRELAGGLKVLRDNRYVVAIPRRLAD
jgi:hypothetical protein